MGKKHIQTLMEITKWPPAFRKYDAFKARILACKVKYKANKFRQSKQRDRREKQSQHLGQSHLPKQVIPQRTRKRNITKLKWFYTVKTCMGSWNPREPNYWSPTLNRYHPAKIWGTKAPVHVWTIHDQLEWECEWVRLSPHITKSSLYIHT